VPHLRLVATIQGRELLNVCQWSLWLLAQLGGAVPGPEDSRVYRWEFHLARPAQEWLDALDRLTA